MTDQCGHGQLYAFVTVTFVVPVEHNSAACISKASDNVGEMCSEAMDKCMTMPAVAYKNRADDVGLTVSADKEDYTVLIQKV